MYRGSQQTIEDISNEGKIDHINNLYINFAVFLMGLSLFVYEVLLTRLFSVILTYNLVFMVVSFAILGSGLGGILAYKISDKSKITAENLLIKYSMWLPISIILSVGLMYFLPFIPVFIIYVFIGSAPFVIGGMLISTIFKDNIEISSKLYLMDLIGSGLGSILVIRIMNSYGFISSVIIVTIISLLFSILIYRYYGKNKDMIISGASIAVLAIALLQGNLINQIEKNFNSYYSSPGTLLNALKGSSEKPLGIVFTKWDAISKTDVIETTNQNEKLIVTDGGAAASIVKFDGNLNSVQYLKNDVNYIPFSYGKNDKSLVIGSGGGKDVLFALLGESKKIDAVEINTSTIEAVNRFKDFNGNIYNRPGVKVYNEDGRNFIENSKEKYDNVYLSMVMTNAIENNMYSLSENYIYTYQAFKAYLDHLDENGKLSFMVHDAMDLAKITNTGIKVLLDKGVKQENVTDYFVIINGVSEQNKEMHGNEISMPLVMFKNVPFNNDEINRIKDIAQKQTRDIIHYTGGELEIYKDLKDKKINYKQLLNTIEFNSKPTTDDSPFFFNYAKVASIEMIIILLVVALVWRMVSKRYINKKEYKVASKYFAGLGAAFMLVEIPVIQKMVLYFGNPSLAFSVVLFSLLISSGIGSGLSGSEMVRKFTSKSPLYLLISGITVIAFELSISSIISVTNDFSMIYKFIVGFISVFPMGVLMGIPFPTGIKKLKNMFKDNDIVPLMWGANGIFSVIGSVLAVIISMKFGFTVTIYIGAMTYIYLYIINPLKISEVS